ncbi:hypothetical protein FRB93_008226 [Tulasnella sp. JGI-2019a]|nr:hypothetical protein FRB93_008226 [Tulasnella sp. JGI-2019a]
MRIAPDTDSLPSPCTFPKLEHLDLRIYHGFPKVLIQKLDLPAIRSLKLQRIYGSINLGDRDMKSLVLDVSWLAQIKSLNLEEVQLSEATLLWTLQRLPLLKTLRLASWKPLTTKKLSERPTTRRGWL